MGYPDTFTGYCVDSPKTWNKFQKATLTPKPFGDHDIDVEIDACGAYAAPTFTPSRAAGANSKVPSALVMKSLARRSAWASM